MDAYLGGRGIDERTFEHQSKRLDDDEAEVRDRLDLVTPQEHDLARTIDFAQALLQDLPGYWNRLEPQHRPQFVAALYPTGLVYEDGSIGTADRPWWMTIFGAKSADESGLAHPDRREALRRRTPWPSGASKRTAPWFLGSGPGPGFGVSSILRRFKPGTVALTSGMPARGGAIFRRRDRRPGRGP